MKSDTTLSLKQRWINSVYNRIRNNLWDYGYGGKAPRESAQPQSLQGRHSNLAEPEFLLEIISVNFV